MQLKPDLVGIEDVCELCIVLVPWGHDDEIIFDFENLWLEPPLYMAVQGVQIRTLTSKQGSAAVLYVGESSISPAAADTHGRSHTIFLYTYSRAH